MTKIFHFTSHFVTHSREEKSEEEQQCFNKEGDEERSFSVICLVCQGILNMEPYLLHLRNISNGKA